MGCWEVVGVGCDGVGVFIGAGGAVSVLRWGVVRVLRW